MTVADQRVPGLDTGESPYQSYVYAYQYILRCMSAITR